ncbi:hypothetical protein TNCT_53921 [Trichonephila clavata]|uniref:Uncharacterized protein n=1 Tax=Trichonephila clavata TaxID=2740835 RepID=A0A8X6FTF2_TRICU|nr:hypothetical protein TNCT_53921 [Trichonephila clavata]
MDTLQASHATSSSFRSAPQSTAVASTRGNIVVPPKREIHGPGEPSTGQSETGHPSEAATAEAGGITTRSRARPPSTGRYKTHHGYQSTDNHMPPPKQPARHDPTRIPAVRLATSLRCQQSTPEAPRTI